MKKKSIGKKILTAIILTLIITPVVTCIFTGYQVSEGVFNLISREDTIRYYKDNVEEDYKEFENEYKPEKIMVKSSKFDHEIPTIYLDRDCDKGFVLLAPGLGGTKESNYKPMKFFYDLGFDVMSLDPRNTGENMANLNTFGQFESYDLLDVMEYANKLNTGSKILWGESMGALAASVACGRDDKNIDYLILDCPVVQGFEMIEDEFKKIEEENGIPTWLMTFSGNIASKLRYGFGFDDLDARRWLKDTNVPVLILNSKKDEVTPFHMGKDLYEAINNDKKLLTSYEDSAHIELLADDPKLYKDSVEKLLEFDK